MVTGGTARARAVGEMSAWCLVTKDRSGSVSLKSVLNCQLSRHARYYRWLGSVPRCHAYELKGNLLVACTTSIPISPRLFEGFISQLLFFYSFVPSGVHFVVLSGAYACHVCNLPSRRNVVVDQSISPVENARRPTLSKGSSQLPA